MKKVVRILVLLIFVALLGFTGKYLYSKTKKKTVIYETIQPKTDNIIRKTVATGKVVPRKEIEIKPQESGIISELYVEPGDFVSINQPIAKVRIIPDVLAVNNAELRLKKAKIDFEDSKKEYERQKQVFEQGVIPEAEFQNFETQYKTSREELNAAEEYLQLVKEGVTKNAGKETNTIIRSTIDGMVLDVPIEEGNSVIKTNTFNEGTTIATVANMNDMIFEGKVDEIEVGKIRTGMHLMINIGAIEGATYDAILEYIAPKAQEENGAIQFEIKANVKLKDTLFIRAGYSANADIVLDRRDSVTVIPESVVTFEHDGDSAYVEIEKEEQVFEKVPIQLGLSDGVHVEVLSGIATEDKLKTNKIIEPKKENGKG